MIERMNRLRELRGLRRSIAERDVARAQTERTEFERRVREAQDAHERTVMDSTARRDRTIDKLSNAPGTPLTLARMANVQAASAHEIAVSEQGVETEREGLAEAEAALDERRDVLSRFLKKERATEGAIERHEEDTRHLPEPGEEDEDG